MSVDVSKAVVHAVIKQLDDSVVASKVVYHAVIQPNSELQDQVSVSKAVFHAVIAPEAAESESGITTMPLIIIN